MDIPPLPSVGPPVELAAYLAGLHVRVQISPATRDDRNSMDHLLRDAAGFSLTGENRDLQDADLDGLLDSRECLLVRVADRLADYGPSGLVAFRQAEGGLVIDAMTLSCTVLGKQVEYALVSALAQIARARRASKLLFGYRASGRNQPMLAFLESVADRESATRYVLPLDVASERIAAAAVSFETWAVDGTLH
jgi:FkbH-like protein